MKGSALSRRLTVMLSTIGVLAVLAVPAQAQELGPADELQAGESLAPADEIYSIESTGDETFIVEMEIEEVDELVHDTDAFGRAASTRCKRVSGPITYRSTTKIWIIYTYRVGLRFCYDGSRVTSWNEHHHRMENVSATVSNWRLHNEIRNIDSTQRRFYRQARVSHCAVKYGCFGTSYPWVRLTVRGSGSATYSAGY